MSENTACVVCAWRGTCNKKFSRTGGTTLPCIEFTRDINLPEEKEEPCQKQKPANS